jgi:septum site-determining protein MinC
MTLLRGKGLGLEVVLSQGDLEETLLELESRLAERPDFYRGTSATVVFAPEAIPSDQQLDRLSRMLEGGGIVLCGFTGGPQIEGLAVRLGVAYAAAATGGELERRRALRPRAAVQLSDSARSLVADFDGARKDIAVRRQRGESSVRRLEPRAVPTVTPVAPAEAIPTTLYHVGTLRGGQSLHQIGNIVVVGDVNPGAELVASGDILVFGSLRGVAHAGAQGDAGARVFALDLAATQLRIATCIAAEAGVRAVGGRPEAAVVREGRIVIVPFDQLGRRGKGATSH